MATSKRRPLGNERRLEIFTRDDLTCLFCGVRPGKKMLHVAHLIPHSRGGSDHDNNLATACRGCNATTGTRIAIPKTWCERDGADIDGQGWVTWKRWGSWVVHFNPDPPDQYDELRAFTGTDADVALTFQPLDYWIALDRVHKAHPWEEHLKEKSWLVTARDRGRDSDFVDHDYAPENWPNFIKAITFARTLVRRAVS